MEFAVVVIVVAGMAVLFGVLRAICSGSSVTSDEELKRLAAYFGRNPSHTTREFEKQMLYLQQAIDGLPKEPKSLAEEMKPWVRQLEAAMEKKIRWP